MSTLTLSNTGEMIDWLECMYAVRNAPASTLPTRARLAGDPTTDRRVLEVLLKDPVASVRAAAAKSLGKPAEPTIRERVAAMDEGELIDWLEAMYALRSYPAESLPLRAELAGAPATAPRVRQVLLRDGVEGVRSTARAAQSRYDRILTDHLKAGIPVGLFA